MPFFGPALPNSSVLKKGVEAKEFLLAKLINAESSCYKVGVNPIVQAPNIRTFDHGWLVESECSHHFGSNWPWGKLKTCSNLLRPYFKAERFSTLQKRTRQTLLSNLVTELHRQTEIYTSPLPYKVSMSSTIPFWLLEVSIELK